MYSPDMVMGGRLRLADGGMVDMSTGDTLDWKHSLWLGNSKVKLVWAPEGRREESEEKWWMMRREQLSVVQRSP